MDREPSAVGRAGDQPEFLYQGVRESVQKVMFVTSVTELSPSSALFWVRKQEFDLFPRKKHLTPAFSIR